MFYAVPPNKESIGYSVLHAEALHSSRYYASIVFTVAYLSVEMNTYRSEVMPFLLPLLFALCTMCLLYCCLLPVFCCANSLCSTRAVFAAISRRWNVWPGGAGLPSFFIADIIFYCQIKIPGSAGFITAICAAHPILTGFFPLTAHSTILVLCDGKGDLCPSASFS